MSARQEKGMWWCKGHGREATYIDERGEHCCDPKLGGILLPCRAIFLPIRASAVYARQEYEKKYRREHRDHIRAQKRAWDADPVNKERRRAYNAKVKRAFNIDLRSCINSSVLRKAWLDAAKETSVGILLFGFTAQAWNYSQTLGSFLDENPRIRRRLDQWVQSKDGSSNVLTGKELAYMLRPRFASKRRVNKRA